MYDDMKKKTFLVDRQPRYLDIAVRILYGRSKYQIKFSEVQKRISLSILRWFQLKFLAVNIEVPTFEGLLGIKTLAEALKNVRLRIYQQGN